LQKGTVLDKILEKICEHSLTSKILYLLIISAETIFRLALAVTIYFYRKDFSPKKELKNPGKGQGYTADHVILALVVMLPTHIWINVHNIFSGTDPD
jgi:hypothetical protein